MRKILRMIAPVQLKKGLKMVFFGVSNFGIYYGQGAEDIQVISVLKSLGMRPKGFFIDIGAYHPQHGSNTYKLYKLGWTGINIDPRPGSKRIFDKVRPRDTNLEIGIDIKESMLDYYYLANDMKLNTFSRENLVANNVLDRVTKVISCPVMPLSKVTDQYLPPGVIVDYLNIDAEGFEMQVLNSHNWSIRPLLITLEQNGVKTFSDVFTTEAHAFLKEKNYSPVGKNVITKTVSTVFYVDNTQ